MAKVTYDYDLIVIGSGPAGSLAEKKKKKNRRSGYRTGPSTGKGPTLYQ